MENSTLTANYGDPDRSVDNLALTMSNITVENRTTDNSVQQIKCEELARYRKADSNDRIHWHGFDKFGKILYGIMKTWYDNYLVEFPVFTRTLKIIKQFDFLSAWESYDEAESSFLLISYDLTGLKFHLYSIETDTLLQYHLDENSASPIQQHHEYYCISISCTSLSSSRDRIFCWSFKNDVVDVYIGSEIYYLVLDDIAQTAKLTLITTYPFYFHLMHYFRQVSELVCFKTDQSKVAQVYSLRSDYWASVNMRYFETDITNCESVSTHKLMSCGKNLYLIKRHRDLHIPLFDILKWHETENFWDYMVRNIDLPNSLEYFHTNNTGSLVFVHSFLENDNCTLLFRWVKNNVLSLKDLSLFQLFKYYRKHYGDRPCDFQSLNLSSLPYTLIREYVGPKWTMNVSPRLIKICSNALRRL